MGYFIPVKQDQAADAAALRAAGEKLDALLQLTEADVDEMLEEFKTLRTGRRERANAFFIVALLAQSGARRCRPSYSA